ncbi:SGNH/GDSL hydrolase family protein [Chryseobacterium bernardetii]|uniref:SGNH/GDSL hydrolase family protein n=1 Tax=Chryseobacterium bernardetii TaxID=1241978 RepID=UPI001628F285|nr:SGNH/GDSL hydrolase family protein [Chryseobacterium bernardetii]
MADLRFIDLEPISGLEKVNTFDPGSLLFAGADGILKRIDAEKFYQLLNNVAKPISPSDPVPTIEGWYKPQKSSDLDKPSDPNSTVDWGTKYPNAGNLRAKSGYDTLFNFDGTVWKKTEVKIDYKERFLSNYLYNRSNDLISDIVLDNGSGNFTIDSTGLKINSSGPIGSGVILNKQTNISERFLELRVKLNPDQAFYVGTKNVENVVGENTAEIDCSAKTLKINPLGSMAGQTKNFTMPIISGREYIVRFYKKNEMTRLELIDAVSAESDYVEVFQTGHFDKYKFGLISGAAPLIITNVKIVSMLTGRAFIGFYGDSITEGNSVGSTSKTPYYKDRFANLIGEYIGRPYYVSGRSAGTIDGVLARMQVEIPILLPRYVFVTIGTNNGNTEAKLNQLVDFCESYGCNVILNLIPLYDGSTAAKNAMIQGIVSARKLLSVKMNVATSLNNDGVTKDDSLFANESGVLIHPNAAGNLKIFNRVFVDAPELFQEAGVIPKAPEVPVADINNIKKVLRSFIEPKYTLDSKFYINDPSHYTIYGVGYWFGRRLKSNNTAEAKTAPQEYYNIWQNISTTQGTKKISKLILNIIPYTNVSSDVIKNANLVGVKNGVVIPLVVGTSETVPTALQRFEISVEEYDTFSIGLYNLDSSPVTLTQTIEFYTVDKTIEDDGVRKAIDANSGGSGGSRPGFIDLIDYGCAGDGVIDDTAKINAAIVELINFGGGFLYGRDRKFKVSSIEIPDVKKWCRIGIMGSIAPAPRFGTVGDFDVKTYNGMEIISSMNNTSKGIINVNAGTGFGGFNLVTLDIQKVTIRAYNNPQCHGINATNAAQLNIEDVIVDTGVYNVNASLPTAITAGILPPKLSNGAWTTYKNTVVCGFYSGVYVYEHTKADNLVLASNKIGLRFYKANHSSLFTRTGFYRNQKDIVVEDFHRFEVQQMAVELVGETQYNENNKWQRSVYNLEDIGNKGSGKISYDVCLGGVGPVDTFTKNGGTGVICTKL